MLRRGFAPIVVIVFLALVALFSGTAIVAWRTPFLDSYLPQPIKDFLGKTQTDTEGAPKTSNTPESGEEDSTPTTEDPTKDWNIYTNTTPGFSFKYPADWIEYSVENATVSLRSQTIKSVLNFYKDFQGGREEPIRFEEKYYEIFDGSKVHTTIYYGLNGDEQSVAVDGTFYPKIPGITFIYGFDLRSDENGLETLSLILSTLRIL